MTRGIVYLLAGITVAELLSFQMGQEWFLPANAAAFLTLLLLINYKLRTVTQRGTENDVRAESSQEMQPIEQQRSSAQPEEPSVKSLDQIFPYSKHDRTNPFD